VSKVPLYTLWNLTYTSPSGLSLQIPEARGLLSHAQALLGSLTESQAQLAGMRGRGERGGEQWTQLMSHIQAWQRELVEIRELVDRGDSVQRKLVGIKRKRVGTSPLT
jgi:hypothetical protein